jgi:iron complex outermembrane receptor protein
MVKASRGKAAHLQLKPALLAMRCLLFLSLGIAASASVAAEPTPASPDSSSPASSSSLEEIVVTARFKSEDVQRTPLSITAFSADALEARGATRIEDISAVTPGVTLEQNTGGFGKSVLAFIRGVGQNDVIPAFEPGVGIYVDDVYQGTLFGSLFELTDVGQVEVLRGPQGTLFGKDNEGGAIRITSTRPRGDDTGFLEASAGNFSRIQVKGAFDFSIIPNLVALRFSGGVNSYNGYVNVIDFVCANPTLSGTLPRTSPSRFDGSCITGRNGDDDVKAFKANLLITPSDDVEINLIADFMDDKGTPTPETLLAVNDKSPSVLAGFPAGPGVVIPGYGNPSATTFGIPYDSRFVPKNPYTTYATYTEPRTGLAFPRVNDIRVWGAAGRVNWKINQDLTLTSISGYRGYQAEYVENWGNAPIHVDDNYYRPDHRQFSEELRVSGSLWDHVIDWTAGGYYFHAVTDLNDFIYLPVYTVFNALDPAATKPGLVFYGQSPAEDKDASAFLHTVWHPTSSLAIEGGLRYSDVSKRFGVDRFVPEGYYSAPVLPGFETRAESLSKASRLDYRASVSYQWTASLMTYATLATGFKGPGVNPRPLAIDQVLPFKEEDLKSYEIGVKSQFLDDRLRVNVAAYRSNYSNLQLSTIAPGAATTVVSNAGKVRIQGVEVEVKAEPAQGLIVDSSLAYLHFKYLALGDAGNVPDGPCLSCTAPFVPDWQASAGIQDKISVGTFGSLTPRLDWSYRSKTYNDLFNSAIASSAGYSLFNAHVFYSPLTDHWSASLEVKNLANKLYFPNKFNQLDGAGILVGQVGMPRTYLVSLRRNFR